MEKTPIIFPEGFNIYTPNEKTASFLFGKASIRLEKFYEWAKEHVNEKGFINLNFPYSKTSKEPYACLDTYVPKKMFAEDKKDTTTSPGYDGEELRAEDIPF